MADIERTASAQWMGELMAGSGKISAGSGVLSGVPYSVPSRFQNEKGTNPEELLAAAHAGCFSMMLAKVLGDEKKTAGSISTNAKLTMGQRDGGWKILKVHLDTEVSGGGIDDAVLQKAAGTAKDQCPVSVLLKPGLESLTMTAKVK